ncbi:aldehyde ferredoxin oxidoreductase family protein [Bacillus dakarensis]|uniref:aldehyde ferredoxin oxidoreductase family protein n=1 Tax=Robertmurraya dakarensis TaxID=1926278 RepID=UPI000980D28A|nr:aldehyde ferredoxin oxidoreductase family protein [Bacillus dakarensis]
MLGGYAGKMLFVNLSTGELRDEALTDELAEKFIGGYGIGAKVLYDMMPAGADPLGPDSVIGFVTGPSNGTNTFFGGRYSVVHKSPISGGWNDSNSGGYFGPELKKAGYDAIFVTGISDKPVYLWINDGKAELKDATHLWGRDTKQIWEDVKEETGKPKLRILAIGRSGENASLISCAINDGHRAPGRGGSGAVMGSKRLKAIAVFGTGKIPVADPDRIKEINKRVGATLKGSPIGKAFGAMGTGSTTPASALSGDSPVKNWGGVGVLDFGVENVHKVGSAEMDKYKTRKYACSRCPMGCGAEYEVKDGKYPIGKTDRPEYETSAAFGSTLLNHDTASILKCNEMCNQYGLDTISAGMTIAWAMECYNEGILSKEELDGIDLQWGDGDAIVAILQKMCDGEGCGAILANGSAYAAKKWGKGEEFLQTACGIELPMHDPRFAPGLARTYQYDPSPGRHVKGGLGSLQMSGAEPKDKYDYSGTGEIDLQLTTHQEVLNTMGICMFGEFVSPEGVHREYIEALTGLKFTDEEKYVTGFRILTMRHAFNVREGIKPSDTYISPRAVGKPALQAGPLAGVTIDTDQLARNFFEAAKWDMETGKPSKDILKELGNLDNVIEDLYGVAE